MSSRRERSSTPPAKGITRTSSSSRTASTISSSPRGEGSIRAQAAKKSGDKKTYQKEQNIYKEVTALLKNNNEEVYSSVTQILSGKKTVKSVFMTGKGVLS